MKFKFLSIFIIFLMIFSTVCAAYATNTNNQKIKNTVIVVNNLTIKSIENAINRAKDGDTILINGTLKEEGEVTCRKSLHVVGQDCVLNKVRWNQEGYFEIEFRNITFSGNNYRMPFGLGAAISAYDNVIVNNCSFINNSCGFLPLYSGFGGAINARGNVNVNNSNFINNTALKSGGAIYSTYGNINVNNSYFKDNKAFYNCAGAIGSCTRNIYVNNSIFVNNNAHQDGGAIRTNNGVVNVENSYFNNNTAYGSCIVQCEGGAIWSRYSVKASHCNFSNNYADDCGGVLFVDRNDCIIDHCLFKNNIVFDNDGGAIYLNGGELIYMNDYCGMNITNSAFYYNHACDYGGAIYTDSIGSHIYLKGNAFENNECGEEGNVVFCYGYYDTISGNWWGTPNPDWNCVRGLIVERTYNPFKDNIKHNDSNPLDHNPLS